MSSGEMPRSVAMSGGGNGGGRGDGGGFGGGKGGRLEEGPVPGAGGRGGRSGDDCGLWGLSLIHISQGIVR